ncbi:MAG: DUF2927 domain-containing protein [Methylocystaceae bacterium]|nr:DUF2927 domain-containing protein [Methylocystaceae bacterium]
MRLILVLCLLFWTTIAQAEAEKINLDTLIKQFNSVVFVNEHGKNGREPKPLIKWKGPIRYSPSGTLTRKQVDNFFKLMNQIQQLTKLDMRMIKKGEKANLIVSFISKAELAKKVQKGINCYGKIGANKDYIIINGNAFVPSDRPDKTDHCLIEETVQLFGLANDSYVMQNSMFYEYSKRTSMSVSDMILLKALYDPRLKPGMTQAEAQPIVKTVLSEILEKASKK